MIKRSLKISRLATAATLASTLLGTTTPALASAGGSCANSTLRGDYAFTIEGLIWGRETLWFDSEHELVAAITTDAEFDHFEAIREGYESALREFVGKAASDEMSGLAELSKTIPGSHASTLAIVGATLIDGTGAAPIADSAVLIHGGRIVARGPRGKVKIPRAGLPPKAGLGAGGLMTSSLAPSSF